MTDPRVQSAIDSLCNKYHETENPFYLWSVYRLCRHHNIQLPTEVWAYLDTVAHNLAILEVKGDKVKWPAIGEAMLMKSGDGRGTRLSEIQTTSRQFGYAFDVHQLMIDGTKEYLAIETTAKYFQVDKETIRRSWKKYAAIFINESTQNK